VLKVPLNPNQSINQSIIVLGVFAGVAHTYMYIECQHEHGVELHFELFWFSKLRRLGGWAEFGDKLLLPCSHSDVARRRYRDSNWQTQCEDDINKRVSLTFGWHRHTSAQLTDIVSTLQSRMFYAHSSIAHTLYTLYRVLDKFNWRQQREAALQSVEWVA